MLAFSLVVSATASPLIKDSSFSMSYPRKEEQQKISHLLSLLDERIATQNKIIEKLQSLIKGLAVALTTKEKANIAISQCLECHSSSRSDSK